MEIGTDIALATFDWLLNCGGWRVLMPVITFVLDKEDF